MALNPFLKVRPYNLFKKGVKSILGHSHASALILPFFGVFLAYVIYFFANFAYGIMKGVIIMTKITERMLNAMQDNLQYIRVYLNLTQGEFGKLVGLSAKSVSDIENRNIILNDNEYIVFKDAIIEYMDKINLVTCLRGVVNSLMAKRKIGNTNVRYLTKNFPTVTEMRKTEKAVLKERGLA